MKITKQTYITIELSPMEAAKLIDIMGCNVSVPNYLGIKSTVAIKSVKDFMDELFDQLNANGFTRAMAEWRK